MVECERVLATICGTQIALLIVIGLAWIGKWRSDDLQRSSVVLTPFAAAVLKRKKRYQRSSSAVVRDVPPEWEGVLSNGVGFSTRTQRHCRAGRGLVLNNGGAKSTKQRRRCGEFGLKSGPF